MTPLIPNNVTFEDFLEKINETNSIKSKIYRKSIFELLYLNSIISPFLDKIYKNKNFLDTWLGKNGRLIAYAHLPAEYKGKTVRIGDEEITWETRLVEIRNASNVFSYLSDSVEEFCKQISKFNKNSRKTLFSLGFREVAEKSSLVLEEFSKENEHILNEIGLVVYVSKILKEQIESGKMISLTKDQIEDAEHITMKAKETFFNYDYWYMRLKNLRNEFYIKTNIFSKEWQLLKTLDSNTALLASKILTKETCKNNLMNGDIIVGYKLYSYIKHDILSRFISKFTKSAATHAGVYIDGKIAEARIAGNSVRMNDLYDRKHEILLIYRANITAKQREELTKIILGYCNNKDKKYRYNFFGLIGNQIARKYPAFAKFMPSKYKFFCSEFVEVCYRQIGYPITNLENAALVSPKDIVESGKITFMYVADGMSPHSNDILGSRKFKGLVLQLKSLLKEDIVSTQY